jgi:hypothetical protein
MSRKKKIRKALMLAGAAYGASKLMGMGANKSISGDDRRDIQKTITKRKPTRVIDTGSKTMVGTPVKTTVDKNALPIEIKEKSDKVAKANEIIKKKVIKRRDDGMLSPLMPKRPNQISSGAGLGIMDGAKAGKMIKARGGGMAIKGMKPTKLY